MINKIELRKFKRFKDSTIELLPNLITYIVGGNNSGKSTILHALAVWEFCKTILIFQKGQESILQGHKGAGYGIDFEDFTALNIPSFKYLWTNLKAQGGYTLSIKCFWKNTKEKFLEIQLSLVQERLFIKAGSSNLIARDKVPQIAYLPTFAGITRKEQWLPPAMRKRLIGQGLAGSVLRNEIIDFHTQNLKLRKEKKRPTGRISKKDLKSIRETDPFEQLQNVVFDIFKGKLYPKLFNPDFQTHVSVEYRKGIKTKNTFSPYKDYTQRDIMTEGSGFLQWLSVYTFALSPNIDILLLDEPDAHLHSSLQSTLINYLKKIAKTYNKQILIATHSVELIKAAPFDKLLFVDSSGSVNYLKEEKKKTVVLSGLGNEYFPTLESIMKHKRILFVENESDATLLKLMTKGELEWPKNLAILPKANSHKERTHIFEYLKDSISEDLKCISLSDRDLRDYNKTNCDLKDKDFRDKLNNGVELRYRLWRRAEIENYLLHPTVIAKCIIKKYGGDLQETEYRVRDFLSNRCGLVINENFMKSNRDKTTKALFDLSGKDIINDICTTFKISKFDIAQEMTNEEVFEDVKTICSEIILMCQS